MPGDQLFKKTRIAPTPSGFLHAGNVFSFALTAALAKKTQASLLLRIDDLDRARVKDAYVQDVFETLHFMKLPYDEGPLNSGDFELHYSQRHRLTLYNQALQLLREKDLAYACSCSRAQIMRDGADGCYAGTCRYKNISLDAPGVCWRLKTSSEKTIRVGVFNSPAVGTVLPPDMNDFVVRKKDGHAAYQLSSLVDDLHFGVDLVVRGEDLWASTLAQLYLAEQLGESAFLTTRFYHHPLLTDTGNRKLSKSAGDTSIRSLRQQGLSAADVYRRISQQLHMNVPATCWEDFAGYFK